MTEPIHILVVDDDDVYWTLLTRALHDVSAGSTLRPHRLSDGDQVIPYLAEQLLSPQTTWPQLILLDERMPRLDGTELLPLLKQHPHYRAIPVCIMSSSDQATLISRCYGLGASFFITKPLRYQQLKDKLAGAIAFWSNVAELPRLIPQA